MNRLPGSLVVAVLCLAAAALSGCGSALRTTVQPTAQPAGGVK